MANITNKLEKYLCDDHQFSTNDRQKFIEHIHEEHHPKK